MRSSVQKNKLHKDLPLLLSIAVLVLVACGTTPDIWDYDRVEVKPEPIYIPTPEYPELAKKLGLEGTVVTRCVVDIDGTVTYAETQRSSGYIILDNAALDAVYDALFEPAMVGGEPVRVWVLIPFQFALNGL
jgi:TonB family protein